MELPEKLVNGRREEGDGDDGSAGRGMGRRGGCKLGSYSYLNQYHLHLVTLLITSFPRTGCLCLGFLSDFCGESVAIGQFFESLEEGWKNVF